MTEGHGSTESAAPTFAVGVPAADADEPGRYDGQGKHDGQGKQSGTDEANHQPRNHRYPFRRRAEPAPTAEDPAFEEARRRRFACLMTYKSRSSARDDATPLT
jgi:hypothetical protein